MLSGDQLHSFIRNMFEFWNVEYPALQHFKFSYALLSAISSQALQVVDIGGSSALGSQECTLPFCTRNFQFSLLKFLAFPMGRI